MILRHPRASLSRRPHGHNWIDSTLLLMLAAENCISISLVTMSFGRYELSISGFTGSVFDVTTVLFA